jgi:hypothetical protein
MSTEYVSTPVKCPNCICKVSGLDLGWKQAAVTFFFVLRSIQVNCITKRFTTTTALQISVSSFTNLLHHHIRCYVDNIFKYLPIALTSELDKFADIFSGLPTNALNLTPF